MASLTKNPFSIERSARSLPPDRLASRGVRAAAIAATCALTLLCVFRTEVATGFAQTLSDSLDGFIQTSIMQHWDNVLHGAAHWNDAAYYYPSPDTLGYNDGFLLNGLLFAAFRGAGADPFLASDLASIVIRAIGFVAFYLFAVDVMALGFATALLGAVLFTVSNDLYIHSSHAQLVSVSFAPLLGWLLWRGYQALLRPSGRWWAAAWGGAGAVLYGAWLLTGFYMAWFAALFLMLMALAALVRLVLHRRRGWDAWQPLLSGPVLLVMAALLLSCTPFLLVYLPKVSETGAHRFAETIEFLPAPADLLNVGSGNLLFGRWSAWLLHPGKVNDVELTIGFPPLLGGLAILGAVLAWRDRSRPAPILQAIAVATALSFLLMTRIGDFAAWQFVFTYVPGGSGLRVVSRLALFLVFPVTIMAMCFLQAYARRWPAWLLALCALLLVAEELNSSSPAVLDRVTEARWLRAIPPAPAACRSFFVTGQTSRRLTGTPVIDAFYPHNVDAMMIAETHGLPTINGFATFQPPGWNFARVTAADYPARVRTYLDEHHLLDGACAFDLAGLAWTTHPGLPLPILPTDTPVPAGLANPSAAQYLVSGWDLPERDGRLADGMEARLSFAVDDPGASSGGIVLRIAANVLTRHDRIPSPISVEVNGHPATTLHPVQGEQTLTIAIPAALLASDGMARVRLRVIPPPTTWPFRGPSDARRLGLFCRTIEVSRTPG